MRNNKRWSKGKIQLAVGAALILIALVMIVASRSGGAENEEIPLSTVIAMAKANSIREIVVTPSALIVHPRDTETGTGKAGGVFKSKTDGSTLIDIMTLLKSNDVEVGAPNGVEVTSKSGALRAKMVAGAAGILPLAVVFGAIFWLQRRSFGFGANKAVKPSSLPRVTFSDVAGSEEAKVELHEVVNFLKHPSSFARLGAHIPKGVLLTGAPGTGKTLLARAVAGEADVPFFYVSGSAFVELFVGLAANRVRSLFKEAKKRAPCIIFIDEIDAIGMARGHGYGAGEQEQALNQILTEMDGFEIMSKRKTVVVMAATNRADVLDPALLRPGRFDRKVLLDLPNVKERQAILELHAANILMVPGVSLTALAQGTPGFSGADLANVVNEAAILATRRGLALTTAAELEEALNKVYSGPERLSLDVSAEQQELVAYHEAGHALVAWVLPQAQRVRGISIVPRGATGGHTALLPDERRLLSHGQLCAMLAVCFGGQAAEEVAFDEVTIGGKEDLATAARIAQSMVDDHGMNAQGFHYSSNDGADPEYEFEQLMAAAYQSARTVVDAHVGMLEWIAEHLIEHKSISGDDVDRLFEEAEMATEGDNGESGIALP